MRLWTVHPKYLDAKGLVALWREGLLAQKVLRGLTKGYRQHPQLARFRATRDPEGAIASYLAEVLKEARRRGYAFDETKVGARRSRGRIPETRGQLAYEWKHLLRKLEARDPELCGRWRCVKRVTAHPMFVMMRGEVREWEVRGKETG